MDSASPIRRADLSGVCLSHALLAVRWLFAILFVAVAVPKLLDLQAFAQAVANYRVLPAALVAMAAVIIPGIELVAGFGLFSRRLRVPAMLLIVVLSRNLPLAK